LRFRDQRFSAGGNVAETWIARASVPTAAPFIDDRAGSTVDFDFADATLAALDTTTQAEH